MAGREGTGLSRGDLDIGGGDIQEPSGRLRGPEEVPTIVMVLRAARHPGTWGGLTASQKGTFGGIFPVPLPQGDGAHSQIDNHIISSQSCGAGNTIPNRDGKWKLDRNACGQQEPHFSPTGPHQVLFQGPRTNPNQ